MKNLEIKSPLHLNVLQVAIDHLVEHLTEVLSEAMPAECAEIEERLKATQELKQQLNEF